MENNYTTPDAFPLATEPTAPTVKQRSKMKAAFVQKDKLFMEARIKDLEKTVRINKEIISELIKSAPASDLATLQKLNTENKLLHSQLKVITKERDEYHARLLISEQIIQNAKLKEQEQFVEFQEKVKDLLDQLDQKEYVLQYIQQRYNKMEEVLRKYADRDTEVFVLLRALDSENFDDKGRRITNVIEENKLLLSKLKEAKASMDHLEETLSRILKICHPNAECTNFEDAFRIIEAKLNEVKKIPAPPEEVAVAIKKVSPSHHRKTASLAVQIKGLQDAIDLLESGFSPVKVVRKQSLVAKGNNNNKSELQKVPSFGDISSIIEDFWVAMEEIARKKLGLVLKFI